MVIPKRTLKIWNDLREEGDVASLAKETGKSEPTIYRALLKGVAKIEVAEKINAFYKRRKKRIASVTIDDNN